MLLGVGAGPGWDRAGVGAGEMVSPPPLLIAVRWLRAVTQCRARAQHATERLGGEPAGSLGPLAASRPCVSATAALGPCLLPGSFDQRIAAPAPAAGVTARRAGRRSGAAAGGGARRGRGATAGSAATTAATAGGAQGPGPVPGLRLEDCWAGGEGEVAHCRVGGGMRGRGVASGLRDQGLARSWEGPASSRQQQFREAACSCWRGHFARLEASRRRMALASMHPSPLRRQPRCACCAHCALAGRTGRSRGGGMRTGTGTAGTMEAAPTGTPRPRARPAARAARAAGERSAAQRAAAAAAEAVCEAPGACGVAVAGSALGRCWWQVAVAGPVAGRKIALGGGVQRCARRPLRSL